MAALRPLAGDIAGPVALLHPEAWPLIDEWATDEDFWVRRSALLTLLPGVRRGGLDRESPRGRGATWLRCPA